MRHESSTVDEIIAAIAAEAHGVVARRELLEAGVTLAEIRSRIERGSLLPVFRGVYRVGHAAPSTAATYIAAVKACGEGAVLCGRAAAHLWGLLKGRAPRPEVASRKDRNIEGIGTRRLRLHRGETDTHNRIPVTSIARTLVDLAAVLPEPALARAFHEASVRYRTDPDAVEQLLRRRPNTPGASALRRVVRGDTHLSLSRLEARFLELLNQHDLPLPKTNIPAGGRHVDCRWPEHKLTVELDSYRYHATRHAWEQDRKRERQAYARGDQFRRYTWGDVFEDPRQMLRELSALLPGETRIAA